MPPPPRPADPPEGAIKQLTRMLGERCPDYDPDCPTCFVYQQIEEVSHLRKENEALKEQIERLLDDLKPRRSKIAELRAALKETLEIARRNESGDYVGRAHAALGDDE